MSILKFEQALELAEELGGWAAYTSYNLGMADTGDEHFDHLLADLFRINEKVKLRSNQLSLMNNCRMYGEPA